MGLRYTDILAIIITPILLLFPMNCYFQYYQCKTYFHITLSRVLQCLWTNSHWFYYAFCTRKQGWNMTTQFAPDIIYDEIESKINWRSFPGIYGASASLSLASIVYALPQATMGISCRSPWKQRRETCFQPPGRVPEPAFSWDFPRCLFKSKNAVECASF